MNRRRFLQVSSLSAVGLSLIGRRALTLPYHADPKAVTGEATFSSLLEKGVAGKWREMPIGELTAQIGIELAGTPYVAGTLELHEDKEVCSVNLAGLDCVTFFENALGIARTIKTGGKTIDDLLAQITTMRYRDGKLTDYASRLHYASEWMIDNAEKGIVEEITADLPGAEKYDKTIDFMSTHPDSYPQLRTNPALVKVIADAEKSLNSRGLIYLPKEKIRDAEGSLQSGDIVAITTSIKGLDVSHTGLCWHDPETESIRLLHASLNQKKVVLDVDLHAYLAKNSKQTGIMVARPVDP